MCSTRFNPPPLLSPLMSVEVGSAGDCRSSWQWKTSKPKRQAAPPLTPAKESGLLYKCEKEKGERESEREKDGDSGPESSVRCKRSKN